MITDIDQKKQKIILREELIISKLLAFRTVFFMFFLMIYVCSPFHYISLASAASSYPKDQENFISNENQSLSNQKEIVEVDANVNMEYLEESEQKEVPDPLATFNKAMYHFNDKFYFWLLKPVACGYRAIFPEPAQVSINNAFSNLGFPLRFINCLLQVNLKGAGIELSRFSVNSTVGIGGLFDPAKKHFKLTERDEDFGQTFGVYGIKEGFYIMWPILGPSTLRDSVGMIGDYFSDPISYVKPLEASLGIDAYKKVNDTSLKIGDYEALKKAAINPYIAIRDAYIQNRETKVKQK